MAVLAKQRRIFYFWVHIFLIAQLHTTIIIYPFFFFFFFFIKKKKFPLVGGWGQFLKKKKKKNVGCQSTEKPQKKTKKWKQTYFFNNRPARRVAHAVWGDGHRRAHRSAVSRLHQPGMREGVLRFPRLRLTGFEDGLDHEQPTQRQVHHARPPCSPENTVTFRREWGKKEEKRGKKGRGKHRHAEINCPETWTSNS